MIKVSVHTALLLYMALFLFFYLLTWLISHLKTRSKKIITPYLTLTTCSFCNAPYLANLEKKVHKCPSCNCFNKKM